MDDIDDKKQKIERGLEEIKSNFSGRSEEARIVERIKALVASLSSKIEINQTANVMAAEEASKLEEQEEEMKRNMLNQINHNAVREGVDIEGMGNQINGLSDDNPQKMDERAIKWAIEHSTEVLSKIMGKDKLSSLHKVDLDTKKKIDEIREMGKDERVLKAAEVIDKGKGMQIAKILNGKKYKELDKETKVDIDKINEERAPAQKIITAAVKERALEELRKIAGNMEEKESGIITENIGKNILEALRKQNAGKVQELQKTGHIG
jgi:hypothetical protein